MQHPDQQVQQAIIKLSDALCTWERNTGRQSVLIIREQGGFVYRAISGKPGVSDELSDQQLIAHIKESDEPRTMEWALAQSRELNRIGGETNERLEGKCRWEKMSRTDVLIAWGDPREWN